MIQINALLEAGKPNSNFQLEPELVLTDKQMPIDIKCPICHLVLISPVSCRSCLNHFCSGCIRQWVLTNPIRNPQICPLCKELYREQRCYPVLQSYLSSLKIKCQNHELGCPEVINYDAYQKHCESCECRVVQCSSAGCQVRVRSLELRHHVEHECSHVLLECRHCKSKIRKRVLEEHEAQCEMKPVNCEKCGEQVILRAHAQHLKTCPENEEQCRWCKNPIKLRIFDDHQVMCESRVLQCEGCQQECNKK